jgi:hypothetical protein
MKTKRTEEMTFPLANGCKLRVLRKYIGEDEGFICTLYDATDKVILIPDPELGEIEHICQVYTSTDVSKEILVAEEVAVAIGDING